MSDHPAVLWLADCDESVARDVGGKARGLRDLIALDLQVPNGFVVTTHAYREAVAAAGIEGDIAALVETAGTPAADREASERIADLFAKVALSPAASAAVREALVELGDDPVAVRSSAVAEDREDASFAGQQETELWVRGADEVERSIVRCWASLFTSQAIGYRARVGVAPEDVVIAVVVQRMVPAVAAGVAMTLEPVTGDRSVVYVEAALGLGEGVVKGDVETDRFWVAKADAGVRSEITTQTRAHRFVPEAGAVAVVDLEPGEGKAPAITDAVAQRVAELGARIEAAHGRPMDIEWAVAADGEVHLVQGRPETVWSNRPEPVAEAAWRAISEMNYGSPAGATWSTTNAAEAVPGVQPPFGCSMYERPTELAFRETFGVIGALSPREAAFTESRQDRIIGFHFGRCALRVDLLAAWVDRIPGGNGEAAALDVFGHVPEGYVRRRELRRYPRVLSRMWIPFVRYPKLVAAERAEAKRFWSESVERLPGLGPDGTKQLLADAVERTGRAVIDHTTLVFGAVQAANEQLTSLATSVGVDPQALMAGHGGHDETEALTDLWAASRDELSIDDFIARHGFHGPAEGDLLSRSWREDPSPVLRLVETYRGLPESSSPARNAEKAVAARVAAEADLLDRLPAWKKPAGRAILAMGRKYIPLRGVGKAAFVQNFDIVRAAARRLGGFYAADGYLDEADDIFMLTVDEALHGRPVTFRETAARRRAVHEVYRTMDVPAVWVGAPDPVTDEVEIDPDAEVVEGIAASPGVVEATVRVALDPSTCEIVPGEILVARDTDPGWASLMFVSGGLVADIGGVMSHTAVVARELGIPCVVGTGHAVRLLRTGDVVRLDGTAGRLQIVSRAPVDEVVS